MTIASEVRRSLISRPPGLSREPSPRDRPVGGRRARGWPAAIAVAVVTAVVPIAALRVLIGPPEQASDWLLLILPLIVAVAVLLAQVRVEVGVILLGVAVVTLFQPSYAVLESTGVWQSVGGTTLFLGICWVTCALGRQLPLGRSAVWMAGLTVASIWGMSTDVPIVILSLGWWLVGVTFRHRQLMTDRLQLRADELAAEQERFALEAVRLERARIAREIHDVVAHCMTVIVIQARAGQAMVDDDPDGVDDALDAILATAREAETDLNALVGVMDGAAGQVLNHTLLDGLVRRAATAGARVQLEVRGDPSAIELRRAAVAHRVVQEALTNALRHAPGASVSVLVDCAADVVVSVENGPAGPGPAPTPGTGRGLLGIGERVAALDGTAAWGSTPTGGWRVEVSLPAAAPST